MKSTPLTLQLEDGNGEKFVRTFRLAFDFNAQCIVEFRTKLSMLEKEIWLRDSPTNLSVMFHAAVLMHQPEYAGEEGLQVLRSYMDAGNIGQISDALNEAFVSTLPEEKQKIIRAKQAERKAQGENPTAPAANSQPTPEAKTAEA
jgi:hypothetical protein